MKTGFRKGVAVLLAVACGLGPAPAPAPADDSVAKIKRIVHDDHKEVDYPTRLVQVVTDDSERDVTRDMAVAAGEAVLTRSANSFVQVEKGREAFLYSNTFVRFDDLNVWLLRNGAVYVVNKRGRLEVVAEALGRVLVNSKVLLRSDGAELFAFVTEGRVVLEAGARTLSLGPGQAGRMVMGAPPEPAPLDRQEQQRITKELEETEKAMKGGGGSGGLVAALIAAGVIAGAAVAMSGDDDDERGGGGGTGGGGTGGSGGLPDLAPAADGARGSCRFEDGRLVVSVRNQGRAAAAPSTAEVEITVASTRNRAYRRTGNSDAAATTVRRVQLRVGGLPIGATARLPVDTAAEQVIGYRLVVDRDGRVRESNEANNAATVRCPPPVD